MRCAIACLLLLLLAVAAAAQIGLYNNEDGSNYECNWLGFSEYTDIYVVVTGEWSGARFSIPQTACIGLISIEPLNGATITGDLIGGIVIRFAGCTTGNTAVARINVFTVDAPCCGFGLLPHPDAASGNVELVDCSNTIHVPTWMPMVSVYNPFGGSYCENQAVSPRRESRTPPMAQRAHP